MTTVTVGTSSSYTFTGAGSIALTLAQGTQARVSVTSGAGVQKYSSSITESRTIGPFATGDVFSVTAQRGSIDYVPVFGNVTTPSTASNAIIGSLTRWQAAKARGAANKARALILGDSNQTGAGAGTSGTENLAGAFQLSMAKQFADLAGWRTDSVCGDAGIANAGGISYAVYDPRVTLGTGWAPSATVGTSLGNRMFTSNASNTNRIGFTFIGAIDSIRITHATASTNNQAMRVFLDGTQIGTLSNTGGTQTLTTESFSFASGIHLVEIDCSGGSGAGYLNRIQGRDSTSTAPECTIGAWYGGTSTNLVNNTTAYDSLPMITELAPDWVQLQCTINDSSTGTALATYYTQMETIIATCAATADGCLEVGFPYSGAGATNGDYDSRATFMRDLARSYGWSFLDLRDTFGYSYTRATAKGLVFDTAHPNPTGHTAAAAARWALLGAAGL